MPNSIGRNDLTEGGRPNWCGRRLMRNCRLMRKSSMISSTPLSARPISGQKRRFALDTMHVSRPQATATVRRVIRRAREQRDLCAVGGRSFRWRPQQGHRAGAALFGSSESKKGLVCAFGNQHRPRIDPAAFHCRPSPSCRSDLPPEGRAARWSSRLLRVRTRKRGTECSRAFWIECRALAEDCPCSRPRDLQNDVSSPQSGGTHPGQ
jgi:hypothetical protein